MLILVYLVKIMYGPPEEKEIAEEVRRLQMLQVGGTYVIRE